MSLNHLISLNLFFYYFPLNFISFHFSFLFSSLFCFFNTFRVSYGALKKKEEKLTVP